MTKYIPQLGTAIPFIVDVVPTGSGQVYDKVFDTTVDPPNKLLVSCETDTDNIRVTVEVDGPLESWEPTEVWIQGGDSPIEVGNWTQLGDARRFSGYADISLSTPGQSAIVVVTPDAENSTLVTRAAPPPQILSAVFGSYPGQQTAVKFTDTIQITGTIDPTAAKIVIENFEASSGVQEFLGNYSSGTFAVTMIVGSRTGINQHARLHATNAEGTPSESSTDTSNTIELDQTVFSVPSPSLTYPATQQALKDSEQATVSGFSISGFNAGNGDTILWQGTVAVPDELLFSSPTVYESTKTITRIGGTYRDTGTNAQIIATRKKNGAVTTRTFLVQIAHTAPTITVVESATKLRSSPGGTQYTITLSASPQKLIENPSLSAPEGSFGAWAGGPTSYTRPLTIDDTDAKGIHNWQSLIANNRARRQTTTITGNATYEIAGFLSRDIVLDPFQTLEAIGTPVVNTANVVAERVGVGVLSFVANNTPNQPGKFTIANAGGDYDPNGGYFLWLDTDQSNLGLTETMRIEETV